MAAPKTTQNDGLVTWRIWDSHYRRSRIAADSNKSDKLRARQASKKNWAKIGDGDRNEHVRLRRLLCDAIEHTKDCESHFETVDAAFQTGEAAKPTWSPAESTESAEALLREAVWYLEALAALIRADNDVGAPAKALKVFDTNRQTWLRERVELVARKFRRFRRAETKHLGKRRRMKLLNKRRNAYLRQSLEQGEVFVPFDGGNNDSKLGYWLKSDVNGNIDDRLVVKDVCFDMMAKGFWSDERLWQNVDDPIEKELTEAYLMRRLQESQSPNVIRLRDSSLHVSELLFRMFIEYCPYGDAVKIIDHYEKLDMPLPEPLIWHFFESLVNAGLVMQQGHATPSQDGWREVVHMDIKPANVFVGAHPDSVPTRDNWTAYPTFKLGDFGLAFETWDRDHDNPEDYLDTGTRGYMASEQIKGSSARLTAKTNVFGISITVMTMMSRNRQPGAQDKWAAARKGSRADKDHPRLRDSEARHYSDELAQLVTDCVSYLPRDRPTFEGLRDTIREYTRGDGASPEDDLAKGMRQNTVKQTTLLGLAHDPYPIHKSIDEVDQGNDSSSSSPDDDEESAEESSSSPSSVSSSSSPSSSSDDEESGDDGGSDGQDRTPIRIKLRRRKNT